MFRLTFSIDDIKILNQALMQMPYGVVVMLIQNINNQLKQQQEQKPERDEELSHGND